MSLVKHWRSCFALAVMVSAGFHSALVTAQDVLRPRVVEQRQPGDVLSRAPREPKFWVGIFCRPADEAMRAQLKIPADRGVVVDGVAPESPAEKAGLKNHDVLLSVGERALAEPAQLMEEVEAVGEKELEFKVLRQGKELMVKVTPAPRVERGVLETFQLPRQNLDPIRMWVERLNDPAHGPLHLRGFGPGVMFGQRETPKLPDDVSIQINKTGQQPAKIVVTRGEEKWELTDQPDELAKLPAELRPAVENLLGLGAVPFQVRVPRPEEALPPAVDQPMSKTGGDVERRLKAVERRLEKLLEELKQSEE